MAIKKCGFHYTLDTKMLGDAYHTINIRVTNNLGQKNMLLNIARVFKVTNLPPKGYLDGPQINATITGTRNVYGWYLDGAGVSKIEVLIDGVVKGQAEYGELRSDVYNAYPAYGNKYCGFRYMLDTKTLTNGYHEVSIRETNNAGDQNILPATTRTFIVYNPSEFTKIKTSNLSVSRMSLNELSLTWDKVDGAVAYEVFRNGVSIGKTSV